MGRTLLKHSENGRKLKMSNYRNHLRFSLRCLDRGLIPVSLRLKNLLRTQKGKEIIYKAERRLLNKRRKIINMTLKHYEHEGYMYQEELKQQIDQDRWEECKAEINKVKELRHKSVLDRQMIKFNKLLEEKNQENNNQGRPDCHSGCTNKKGPSMHRNGAKNGLQICLVFLSLKIKNYY